LLTAASRPFSLNKLNGTIQQVPPCPPAEALCRQVSESTCETTHVYRHKHASSRAVACRMSHVACLMSHVSCLMLEASVALLNDFGPEFVAPLLRIAVDVAI
jgi:hypothetical protein